MKQRRGRTRFQDHLAHIKAQNPDFAHPGLNNDKLRSADCIHGIVKDCSGCLDLVDRPSRNNENLVFHQSTIASGNTVIKNARERDRLSKLCNNARCLEMEAAGVMNEIRPLIIRGIADYADGHKNSRWHDYAAAAAAAFAKELLYTIAPTTVEVLQSVSENGGKSGILCTWDVGFQLACLDGATHTNSCNVDLKLLTYRNKSVISVVEHSLLGFDAMLLCYFLLTVICIISSDFL